MVEGQAVLAIAVDASISVSLVDVYTAERNLFERQVYETIEPDDRRVTKLRNRIHNGAIAFIGVLIAYMVMQAKVLLGLEGLSLVTLVFFGLWTYLFLSDIVEDELIKRFN